ncbi:hypothetical protein [Fischerella sp.]|nr:hypothetical protein [Fischerella sp.]
MNCEEGIKRAIAFLLCCKIAHRLEAWGYANEARLCGLGGERL